MVESLPTMIDTHIKEQVKKQVPEEVRDQVPVYVAEGLIMERQKTKEEMEQMIAKAILQERGNIQAEISSQIQKAIDHHIPSQVDTSVGSYMSRHILHVHPTQTQTVSVLEKQYQLYLSMKDNPQLQQQDIAIWLALQMKFENLQVPQTTCRPSAVRPRDQDDPLDDAPPKGENIAKWQKTSEYKVYVSGESSSGQVNKEERGPSTSGNQEQEDDYDFWTDSYASDDDEIPTKQVSQDIIEEVSLTIYEAKPFVSEEKKFRPEKIVLSLHKFPAIIFNDDDIEERTSRWVNKCVKKFNPYALYGVEHWKNPHAKIFYIRKQKEPGKSKEELFKLKNRFQVHQKYRNWGTPPDYKNLNKTILRNIYLCDSECQDLTENQPSKFHSFHQFWQTASASTIENEEMEITGTIDERAQKTASATTTETYIAPKTLTQKLFGNMRRISKGYNGVDIPLFPTMLVQGPIFQGEGSTVPVESHHTPTSAPSTSQPPTSPPSMQTTHVAEEAATMPHDSPLPRVHSLGSDEGSMTLHELTVLCTTLSKKVESLESDLKQTKLTYGAAYTKLIMKVKKLENRIKSSKARRRVRLIVSEDEGDLEDPSKQGRKIAQLDEDEGITLVQMGAQTQGRHEHDLEPDFEFTAPEEVYTAEPDISTANVPVSTAGAEVSTASPEVKTAAESLVYIRRSAAKRKDKGKAIMKEAEPVQKKTKLQLEQERLGYEEALRLQEQLDEEERQRIARVHEEANTFNAEEWDNIQAQIEADEELAQKLQAKERGKFSEVEKARLLVEMINERKRLFAQQRAEQRRNKPMTQAQQRTYMSDEELAQKLQAEERGKFSKVEKARLLVEMINERKRLFAQQRAEQRRNKPMTQAQQRTYMCNYIKNMGSHTLQQLKKLSFDEIKELFETTIKRVKDYVPMERDRLVPKISTRSSKRTAEIEVDHEGSKRQKTNEEQSAEEEKELSEEELQKLMMIVPVEEIYVEALQVELKRLFEPDIDDILWKLQRYMHDPLTWKLYDTCSVHHVSTDIGHDIFMLVEKDCPLTRGILTLMLCNKLQVDQYSDMANELLKKIFILANRPRQ
ncbi:hypothetical protein Tco_0835476 [Tanacetum coccineum]